MSAWAWTMIWHVHTTACRVELSLKKCLRPVLHRWCLRPQRSLEQLQGRKRNKQKQRSEDEEMQECMVRLKTGLSIRQTKMPFLAEQSCGINRRKRNRGTDEAVWRCYEVRCITEQKQSVVFPSCLPQLRKPQDWVKSQCRDAVMQLLVGLHPPANLHLELCEAGTSRITQDQSPCDPVYS